jgi:hypothetical protein
LRASSFPIYSSTISWKIPRSLSFLAPLNPTKGDCGRDEIDGSRDGRDANVDRGGDAKL